MVAIAMRIAIKERVAPNWTMKLPMLACDAGKDSEALPVRIPALLSDFS
jgi:hypothetical protein